MTDETVIPPDPEPIAPRDLRAEAAAEDAAAAELAANPPEPEHEPEPEPEPVEAATDDPPAKPEKNPTKALVGRIGHLTKQLSAKDAAIEAANARAEAAERLLNASGTPPAEPATTERPAPANGRYYTVEEFQAEAARVAAAQEFNRQSNEVFDKGNEAFPDWVDAVTNLNALGIMSPTLLEAAMATDAAAAVIHHLGTDPDEAARITSLPPARMGAELAKLGLKLAAPKSAAVSRAPAPIRPVTGQATPTVDLARLSESGSMKEYAAARKAQGSRWAESMNPRK